MRKINTLILLLSAAVSLSAQSVDITFVRGGGKSETKTVKPEKISPDTYRLKIAASEIPSDVERLELTPDFARAKVGDDGYFILPNGAMTKFLDRKDGRVEIKRGHMAFVGSKTPAGAYASIVKSMPYFFSAKNVKKGDSYTQTVFFDFKHLKPYADVLIDYVRGLFFGRCRPSRRGTYQRECRARRSKRCCLPRRISSPPQVWSRRRREGACIAPRATKN